MNYKYQKKDTYLQKKDNKSLMNYKISITIMEYQKIMTFLDNAPNLPSKYRTKNWVEMMN